MANIKYNNAIISNAKITRFITENEFEGDNFNRTGRKHTLEGVGVIGDASSLGTSLTAVKSTLSVPAKSLEIQFDGDALYTLYATGAEQGSNFDSRNGPLPQISVSEIAGNTGKAALLVSFTFVWFECGNSVIQRAELVQTHSINEDGMLRIQRRGFLRISAGAKGARSLNQIAPAAAASSANPYPNILGPGGNGNNIGNAPPTPDMYRRLVAGVPPQYFQRVKQEFYVEANQNTLVFDIEDAEMAEVLPWPVLNGDGSFEYSRDISGNIQGTKTFRIELVGNADATLNALFFRCVDIALTKISFTGSPPDIIQSFRITQSSLFKRRVMALEIVALGIPRNALQEPGTVDAYLYQVLFASPNPSQAGAFTDAYGSLRSKSSANASPYLRHDPCTLTSTWQSITGASGGWLTSFTPTATSSDFKEFADSNGDSIVTTTPAGNEPDELLKEEIKNIVTYSSSQSINLATNCNFLVPMGFGFQYGFQFALPEVFVTQRVEMISRSDSAAIPWPVVAEGFVVISQSIQVNDAAPDATGHRLFAIHATRTIKVSVANSPNTTTSGTGGSGLMPSGLPRVVWMPEYITTGRNPVSGFNTISIMENQNGEAVRQDYVNPESAPELR